MQKFSSCEIDPYDADAERHWYDAADVESALAAKDAAIAQLRDNIGELIGEKQEAYESGLEKDRDLADANHALMLANNSADAFRRVAEQRQGEIERLRRAVEWCLQNAAYHGQIHDGRSAIFVRNSCCAAEVPAEFADILKPTTGARNG